MNPEQQACGRRRFLRSHRRRNSSSVAKQCIPSAYKQRDEHIRRYAELLEQRPKIQMAQNAAPEIGYKKPPPQTKGAARQIAEETGLSVDTVRRALNPKPPAAIKSVVEPESDRDAIIREANAIVSAWNRARQRVGSYPLALRIWRIGRASPTRVYSSFGKNHEIDILHEAILFDAVRINCSGILGRSV